MWLVRFMLSAPASPPAPRWAWPVLVVARRHRHWCSAIFYFHVWQDHVRDLMGVPRLKWFNYPQAGPIAVVLLFLFVEIGQLVGRLIRFLVRQLDRVAPPRVSFVVVVAMVLALSIAILNGVVVRGTMSLLNKTFAVGQRRDGPEQSGADHRRCAPAAPARWSRWASLGHQGRIFVGRRPDRRAADASSTTRRRSSRSAPMPG